MQKMVNFWVMQKGQNFNKLRLPTVHYSDRIGNCFSWHKFPVKMTRFMNLNLIWGYSIASVPKIASSSFKKRSLFAPDSVLRSSKFRTEMIAPWKKIAFAFLYHRKCPKAALGSHGAACLLCFIAAFFFLLHNPGRGRRAGVTHTQRLICLLIKRNFSPQFRLDPLINSGGLERQKEGDTERKRETEIWCLSVTQK